MDNFHAVCPHRRSGHTYEERMKNEQMIAWMNECSSHTCSDTYAMLHLWYAIPPRLPQCRHTSWQTTNIRMNWHYATRPTPMNGTKIWHETPMTIMNEWKVRWSLWMCMYPITLLRDRRLKHNCVHNQTRYSTLLHQYRQHERGNI